jgi:antirestriction protein ArdC
MPQIWMTYHEIAEMLGCDMETARATTIQRGLDRKKSRDGMTRARLDVELTAAFIAAIRNANPAMDQAVRDLRILHEMMSRSDRADISATPGQDNPGRTAAG